MTLMRDLSIHITRVREGVGEHENIFVWYRGMVRERGGEKLDALFCVIAQPLL